MGYSVTLIDDDILKEDFPEGISVTFKCSVGHTSNGGSGVTVCKAGNWTTLALTCKSEYFFVFVCGTIINFLVSQPLCLVDESN